MKFLFLLLPLFLSISAHSDYSQADCNVSVLTNPGVTEGIREHFNTPFDQGGTETCYAHVASDLLSFRSGQSISPIGAAYQLALSNDESFNPSASGEVVDVIDLANQGTALCRNAGYNSRTMSENGYKPLPRPSCSGQNLVRIPPISGKFYRDCQSGTVPRYVLPSEFREQILDDVNAELDRLQPVGLQMNMAEISPASARLSGRHAMTAVGRVWRNSRCEIVIRNSYGPDACADMLDRAKLSCETPAGFPRGTFSVSEDLFKRATERVFIMNAPDTGRKLEVVTPSICRPESESAEEE